MHSSDSDNDSDWNRELFFAVSKKQGNGPEISEQARCEQMQDCLVRGANINHVDKNGNTVLHNAVKKGYQGVVKFLLQCGAVTDIRNKRGYTAVTLAQNLGQYEIADILKNPIAHRPTAISKFKPIDNEKPSTSRENTSLRPDSSLISASTQSPKRKLNTGSEYFETAKKRHLALTNHLQSKSHRDGTVNSSGGTSLGHPRSGEDEEMIIQPAHFDPNETYAASGLKRTLHGIVYQWKHLMLVLNRAWKMGYSFRLSTEMDAAEKFDDLVLEYVDNRGNKMHRFVQVKHKKDNTKTIGARDLLDTTDGEFSVLKYFISWRKIRSRSDFDRSDSKSFTLCTNIGIDVEGLKKANIYVSAVTEPDDFLKVMNRVEQPPRYKLQMAKQSELYHTLKSASDVHRLARELADRVHGSKDIHLNTDMFKCYHTALSEEIIDIKNQKFSNNFLKNNNLSAKAKNFRENFLFHLKRLSRRNASEKDILKGLEENKLKLSTSFGTRFELVSNPELTHVGRFSLEFVKLLNPTSNDNVVKIDRRIYSKRASDLSIERVVADNIDKLAGHVLIIDNGKIKFRSQFLNDDTPSLGNIEKFKDALKTGLGNKFDELGEFEFEINNFKTCTEEELSARTELPDDDIGDEEILKFLNGFILAVDQPDETELGEMIRDEIGHSQFNLPDAKFVTDSFQIEILDWFKETGSQSVFLLNENAKNIFNEIEGRLSSLITTDLRLEYPEELKEWGIRFERKNRVLNNFVKSSNFSPNPILLISSRQSLLTALRVYQTLTPPQRIETYDGFIFIRLRRLLETKIMDQVLRAFKWRRNHNLLIVDCESINLMQYAQELWNPLYEIMRENDGKRMILITQGNVDSFNHFGISYKPLIEKDDEININNLTRCSRQKLLKQKIVKFQGQEESFGQLLRIYDFENIESEKLKALEQIIDPITLVQLIKGKEIQIGRAVEGMGTIADYYIYRTIIHHVVIKGDIFRATGLTDLFAIGGVGRKALGKFLADQEKLRSFEYSSQVESHLSRHIILSNGREVEEFKILCERNPNRNIHWLQGISGKFTWIESFGDITNLVAHQDANRCDNDDRPGATYLKEDELVVYDEQRKVVILSDTAGMGKSTVMTSLARKMKDNESSLLVIRINLTQHTAVLAEEKANRTFNSSNTNGAVDFLVDKLSRLNTDLESQVYKTMIKDEGNAALLFDGFDEINPMYGDVVISLLQALAKLPVKKLLVTTRPYTSNALEQKLGTFAHRLQPFSPENQIEFLKRFWQQGLSENDLNETLEKRLEVHAVNVMNLLVKSINHQMVEFTGVPLQTMMVAEVYQYGGESFHEMEVMADSDDGDREFPEIVDLIDLYGKFVDKKYHIYCTEKKRGDHTNVADMEDNKNTRQIFFITHEKLALDALFDDNTVEVLLSSQPEVIGLYKLFRDENAGEQRTGIITQVIDHKPQFIHRTFAEYFVAKFLINTLTDDSRNLQVRNFFVAELFVEPQYKTIRAFLKCQLSRETYEVENKSWKVDLRKSRNANGETVYHVAAKECSIEIVRFCLNRLLEHNEDNLEKRKTGIELQDMFCNTPLAVAINTTYNLDIVKLFVEAGANISCKSPNNESLLHKAVQKPDNLAIVKYLCDKGLDVNFRNTDGWTPLRYAVAKPANLTVVKNLIENGADVNIRTREDVTPLHKAVTEAGNLDIVKHLIEKGANVNFQNHYGMTPLHKAVTETGNLNVVKHLIDKGADVNCQEVSGAVPLHYAVADVYNLDVVKHLCENGANIDIQTRIGSTPLHKAAAQAGNLSIVKYLCEQGANINCQETNGSTPLHYAVAEANKSDVVKCLYEYGADVRIRTVDGSTPLHKAATEAGNLDIVRYICEKGADVNCQQENGSTPLHCAARAGDLEIVKYLCDKGANINCQENSGSTPLHYTAVQESCLDVMKYLCDNGADVNIQAQDGETPLHRVAAKEDNFDLAEYLYTKDPHIDQVGSDPTLSHNTANEVRKLDVIKYLCERGACINCQDNTGSTPLHYLAVRANGLDAMKYLCEKGADVNIQTHDGFTPLHKAAAEASVSDIVKYLCIKLANTNCEEEDGGMPRDFKTVEATKLDVVKYLIEKGANVNTPTEDGCTPLHLAVKNWQWEIVKFLLENGADTNFKNKNGEIPLSIATSMCGDLDMLQNLFGNRGNIDN